MERGSYTIGQLAAAAAVATSTIRFYERNRLLEAEGRTESNYRRYGDLSLERLKFIRAAQATGFTLEDIAVLLSLRDRRTAPCKEVQVRLERRLGELRERLGQLQQAADILRSSLRACRRAERSGRCEVIDKLKVAATRPSAPRPRVTRGRRHRVIP